MSSPPDRLGAACEPALLGRILASLDTAVIALDRARRLLFINPAGERLLRLAATPVRGERLAALARVPELVRELDCLPPGPSRRRERLELADGRVWQTEIVALAEPSGGAVILARDAGELARLESLRRDFLAAVSHELRTPLTSIRGYAEMLAETPEPAAAERRQALATIAANARRLERLAQDLVTLSALETGHYPFRFEALDPAALLAPAAAVLAPLAAERGSRITIAAAEPGRIRADAEALHRVLVNLLENAVLHAGAGTQIVVAGRALALESGEQAYRIEVRDDGAGIGSADQPHVFERFYRVDRGRAPGGSGLGLALVKHIVREHGGDVGLTSRLGAGCAFVCTFPGVPPAPPTTHG